MLMALPLTGDQDWEICNDDGFVYRRLRRHRPSDEQPRSPLSSSLKRDAGGRRARKKKTLLSLKHKYQTELEKWAHLSASLAHITAAGDDDEGPTAPPVASALAPSSSTEIEELLLQVKAQEAMIGKMRELCECAEAVCDTEEERMVKTFMNLPIWGSPKCLVASLMSM